MTEMGVRVVKVPDVGEGIAEVELVAWHVKAGDTLAEDQALADVMTDKATVEIPSPVAGRVLSLGGVLGQVMAVGAELIRIEVDGAASGESPPPAATAPAAAPQVPAVPMANTAPAPEPVLRAPQPSGDRPIASPSVRRRAWELGVDLQAVRATGTAGRITQADLEAYAKAHPEQQAQKMTAAAAAPREGEHAIAIVGMRRRIALKMQEAKRRIPHFTYVEEVDVSELEDLRETLNTKWGENRGRLTLLPFLMRALVAAVRDHPQINAQFNDDTGTLVHFDAVHIGIATQTEVGLMVPVVRHAEALDLWASARELARLAERARGGNITRDELSGSTITITSLGALGGIVTTPIINRPEVAIVGVNRIVERPVIRSGAVIPRKMMNLSSSFDHRVIDGKHAAEFVQSLRISLECPGTLFVE
jgi:2-oxoisovalerate dehydrogenase E2 component (dihydrolipoyl transacylase)